MDTCVVGGAAWLAAGAKRATTASAAVAIKARNVLMEQILSYGVFSPDHPVGPHISQSRCSMWNNMRACESHDVPFTRASRRDTPDERHPMSKRARKRRSRKGNKANHGRKPNA